MYVLSLFVFLFSLAFASERPNTCDSELVVEFAPSGSTELGVVDGAPLIGVTLTNTGDCVLNVSSIPFEHETYGLVFGEFVSPRLIDAETTEGVGFPGELRPFEFRVGFTLDPEESISLFVVIDTCSVGYEDDTMPGTIVLSLNPNKIRVRDEHNWRVDSVIPGADIVGDLIEITCSVV